MDKKHGRIRRSRRTRAKIKQLAVPRLSVFRTPRHIYAQIIAADGMSVVAAASTLQPAVKEKLAGGSSGNVAAAAVVGGVVSELALAAGIKKVAFDRSGFKYHGRVKALATAARENGLEF